MPPYRQYVITADEVVVWQGTIRDKPQNAEEARAFLRGYAEGPAETVTAVVVTHTATGVRRQGIDRATVWFRRIPEEVIAQVIAPGEVFAHAGGFSLTDPLLVAYIERIDGTAESVIALRTALTRRLIHAALASPASEGPRKLGRSKSWALLTLGSSSARGGTPKSSGLRRQGGSFKAPPRHAGWRCR